MTYLLNHKTYFMAHKTLSFDGVTPSTSGALNCTKSFSLEEINSPEFGRDVDESLLIKDLAILPESFNAGKHCTTNALASYDNDGLKLGFIETKSKMVDRKLVQLLSIYATIVNDGEYFPVTVRVNSLADLRKVNAKVVADPNTLLPVYCSRYATTDAQGQPVERWSVSLAAIF